MAYEFRMKLTPRLTRMLNDAQERSERRDDGYLGAEHVLEAILEEPDSVPAQLISNLGATEALRQDLADFFAREVARRGPRESSE